MNIFLLTELQKHIAQHGKLNGDAIRVLPNVTLMTTSAPTPPIAEVTEPVFALVAQGAKRVGLGNQIFDYSSGQYLIVSVDLPLDAHVSK